MCLRSILLLYIKEKKKGFILGGVFYYRFHVLTEFDNGKRSCRKRLADHNRRRRKTTQQSNQGSPNSQPFETTSPTDAAASTCFLFF